MKIILAHEWRIFLRNRMSLLSIGLFLVAGIYGIYFGNSEITRQNNTIRDIKEAEVKRFKIQKSDFKKSKEFAGWQAVRAAINAPTPLANFSIGQRDVFPYYKSLRTFGFYGDIFSVEIANPMKLLTGNFDLAFVFIFLLPLLIIALSFNVISGEKELGTLSLILSNQIGLKKVVFLKLLLIFLVVISATTLLFLIGIIWANISLNTDSILWLSSVCVYISFWFSVSFWVVSLQKSSSTNALSLLSCWLVFVLIIPTMLNLYLESTQNVANAATMEREFREIGEEGWNENQKQMAEKYMVAFPQIKYDTTKGRRQELFWVAVEHFNDEKSKGLFSSYKQEMNKKLAFAKSLSWLSPAIQLQTSLNQLANTDTDAHLNFVNNIEGFYGRFKGFFDLKRITNQKFKAEDFDKIPVAEFEKIENLKISNGILINIFFAGIFVFGGIWCLSKQNLLA